MIKVKDLPDLFGKNGSNIPHLHCDECFSEYSANKHDYFLAPKEEVMSCCGMPLRLVRVESRLVDVDPITLKEIIEQ